MKSIFYLCALLTFSYTSLYGQAVLDTQNYHIYFFDDFNYPVPIHSDGSVLMASTVTATAATPNTTVVGQTFSHNWEIKHNLYDVTTHQLFKNTHVEMHDNGILRIKAEQLVVPYHGGTGGGIIDNHAGWFGTTDANEFGYGIFEVKMKTHVGGIDVTPDKVRGALWIGPVVGPTEIDFPDNIYDDWWQPRVRNWAPRTFPEFGVYEDVNWFSGYHSFHDDFHILSCRWTPSHVKFYIDRTLRYTISYTQIRTFANSDLFYYSDFFKYAIQMVIWSENARVGEQYWIDFDWVKVWKPNCGTDIFLDNSNPTATGFSAPDITTDISRNEHISMNVTSPSSSTPLKPRLVAGTSLLSDGTILEAESTTILPNFVADASDVVYKTTTISVIGGSSSGSDTSFSVDIINNGYFQVIVLSCDVDDRYYMPGDSTRNPKIVKTDIANPNIANVFAYNNEIHNEHNPSPFLPENVNKISQIQVNPNPTNNNITISYPCKSDGQLEIGIKDVSGRIRYSESVTCSEGKSLTHAVDMSTLPAGVYFVNLTLNDQHTVKKVVKL